jgi:hypothetical protein
MDQSEKNSNHSGKPMFKNHNLKKSKFGESFKEGTYTSLPDQEDMMQGREYSYTDLT